MRRTAGIFILAILVAAPGCGRRKTTLVPPSAETPETLYRQGLKDFHSGTPEGYAHAAEEFRKAAALKPESCEYPLNLVQSLLFLSTEQLLNWEDYAPRQNEAKELVDSVAGRCMPSHESFVLRLQALIAGRGPAASELINRAVDLDSADPMNWVVLGYLDPLSRHLVTSEGSGRWLAMTHAEKLKSDSALIQYEFGKNHPSFGGKASESQAAFNRVVAISPRHFRTYLSLAYTAGEDTDPEPLYLRVVDLAPNFLEGRIAAGSYYGALDDFEKAAAQYTAAIALNPKFDTAHFRMGQLMLQADRPEQAERYFTRAVELNPGSFEAYYNLGNIAYGRNDFDKAKIQYEAALKVRENYAEAEYGLGHVFRQKNQIDLAEAQFDKVIRIRPAYGDAYMSRADVRTERRQFAQALADYGKAIESYEDQLKSLNASIAYAEAHSGSRALQAEKKRNLRDRSRTEALLQRARDYKSEVERTIRNPK